MPGLLIRALRDPDGANLDRVQVIKGWVDAEGVTQERVHDVACADGRAIVDGACDGAVGNTVDVARASYTNAIGDPFLETWWQDPDFDPSLRAFYYVRVLEIPTPRWTTYDAAFFGIDLPDSGAAQPSGARLYLADLVFADKLTRSYQGETSMTRCANPASRRAAAHASTSRRRPSTDRYEGSKAGSRMRTISSSPVISSRP